MNKYNIKATVRSKKNSRRVGVNRGRVFSIPSKAYEQFKLEALQELMVQKPKDLTPPYRVSYVFFLKGKGNIDLDNAVVSINDVLQEARIIRDDGFIKMITAHKKEYQKENKTVIGIIEM
jgi:Holliday junction resolvase RusA-like endonuclease